MNERKRSIDDFVAIPGVKEVMIYSKCKNEKTFDICYKFTGRRFR